MSHDPSDLKHILLVDDDDIVRRVLANVIKQAGFMVTEAIHGVDALDKMAENPPHLIVTDLVMPLMDGFSLVQQLSNSSQYNHIPVILLTGHCDESVRMRAQSLGIEKVISKLVGPEVIQEQAALLLSGSG